jgi:hypothetical protein
MMTSVTGKRGIGKTYLLAKELYKRSQSSFFCISNFSHVYTNIDCSKEEPEYLYDIITEIGIFKERGYQMVDLDPRFIHSGVFIAIDEAHLYFSADLFSRYKSDPKFIYLLKFLAQARKTDVEIWYSTQDPAKVDINFRRYTEDYIRYVPIIPFYRKKDIWVQRPPRDDGTTPLPYLQREIRYPLPILWEEHHKLDASNPVFNYAMIGTENGSYEHGVRSTMQDRRMVLSGWMDPFPYKLYDSNQMLAMKGDPEEKDFRHILNFGFQDHTMKREKYPTFKKLIRMKRSDEEPPKRIILKDRKLPLPPKNLDHSKAVLRQPMEFLDAISFFNKKQSKKMFKPLKKLRPAL